MDQVDCEWVLEARRNSDWIEEHLEELLQQYDGQWIAVANQQLIAHDPDPEVVSRQVQGYDPTRVLRHFITSEITHFVSVW
jgi:hypothetical protein